MKFIKNVFLMVLVAVGLTVVAQDTTELSPSEKIELLKQQTKVYVEQLKQTANVIFHDDVYAVTETKSAEETRYQIHYIWKGDAVVKAVTYNRGMNIRPGRDLVTLSLDGRSDGHIKAACVLLADKTPGEVGIYNGQTIKQGQLLGDFIVPGVLHDSALPAKSEPVNLKEMLVKLWNSTGICDLYKQQFVNGQFTMGLGKLVMVAVGIVLLILAVYKGFEPLLLVPIGFGAIMANVPLAGIAGPDGLLGMLFEVGLNSGAFPLFIFMGVGAMTDFGPLIANPKTALLGGAAQFGIFGALIGAVILAHFVPSINFGLKEAASIGIIGGADGPTAIYLTSKLAPNLLGAIAVAAYSYMALVPIIQPPIMRALTTKKERTIRMSQLRSVSKLEKICFPVIIVILCLLLLPDAAPLISMLMFGNFAKECGVVDRLSDTAQNALINIVTICLGLTVGSKLAADKFLTVETLGILLLGCIAFAVATATGIIFGKIMCRLSGWKINPLIGAAGVSAVPMAARVANKVGMEDDPHNFLLMHAMGPNVAGVIGSAVAAGVLLTALNS